MVSDVTYPKDFFIYGNGSKLWVVMGDSLIEIKDYMIDNFNFTIDRGIVENELLGDVGNYFGYCKPNMEFDLHAIVTDADMIHKENIDVSDFYTVDECKKLSKIIQRKFDKILENGNNE